MSNSEEENINYKLLFKIIIVGESCVGKSNIISRYLTGQFDSNTTSTLGAELSNKYLKIKDITTKLQIWDTAGQERYHAIVSSYFKGSHGCFIVYDITQEKTFEKIEEWYQRVKENANKDVSFILVGNKCDLENDRVISKEKGEEKAKNLNCPFFETSARSDVNIKEIFNAMLDNIYEKNGNELIEEEKDDNVRNQSTISEGAIEITPGTKEKEEKKGCC